MWHRQRNLASSAIVALAVAAVAASPQQPQDNRLRAAATAVTVDVVVRDQRGRPVTDLRRSDFQLLEDDVPQRIGDLTRVGGASPASPKANAGDVASGSAAPRGAQGSTSTTAPTFVALVFDRLSAEARALAHKGALAYLDTNRGQDFAGVFLSDLSLVTLQTFSTDRARVKKAIDEAASRVTGSFERLRIGPQAYGDPDPGVPPTASAESHGRSNPADPLNTNTVDPGSTPQMTLVAMMSRMERAFEAMVPGRNVTVRARSGYLAVRSPGILPLLTYEGPALATLERTPLPAQVPVRANAFVFPQPGTDARVAVLVATDGGVLAESAGKTQGANQTDFTILTRLKDATGEVVRKGSQRYRLPADLRGDVLFFRQPTLPPGAYTLEYVVHDGLGQRAGAGIAPVIVQDKHIGQPQVSSLLIVQRTERVPPNERDATNPLYYDDLLLYPNLGEPISKRETASVTFAFNVIAGSAPVHASLTLSQGDRALGETALPLASPDANRRILHTGQLPLTSVAPGDYTLVVTVMAGANTETRRAMFRVIE